MQNTAGSADVVQPGKKGCWSSVVKIALITSGLVLCGQMARYGVAQIRPDPIAETAVSRYLQSLSEELAHQGVWLQTERAVLAHHQGTVPLPVASLTKIATSLAALHAWGPAYQFMTLISATGPIRDGVLAGDLVVQGGGDPFFVTEDALGIRQDLEDLGVKRVTGKLIITGDFYMNFRTNAELAGKLLKQTLQGGGGQIRTVLRDKRGKPRTVVYRNVPAPHIAIAGPVQIMETPLLRQVPLLRHRSPSLVHILKRMNVYSNNAMANMVTETLGGPYNMVRLAALGAGVAVDELRLSNGSGLGAENQLSPRTVCALLVGIQRALRPAKLTIADVFPVAGQDSGTIRRRHLPFDTVVKTGTLRNVSTLAGVLLTRTHGPVWFALINRGGNVGSFREQQDVLLQTLMQEWGAMESPPPDFSPSGTWTNRGGNDILLYAKGPRG